MVCLRGPNKLVKEVFGFCEEVDEVELLASYRLDGVGGASKVARFRFMERWDRRKP